MDSLRNFGHTPIFVTPDKTSEFFIDENNLPFSISREGRKHVEYFEVSYGLMKFHANYTMKKSFTVHANNNQCLKSW